MGNDSLIDIMLSIFIHPKSLQSNFSREHAYSVARLASLGLISTGYPLPTGGISYGHHWRLTHKGLKILTAAGAP